MNRAVHQHRIDRGHRSRRGMTLMEVMITVAVMLMVTAVMAPSISSYWMLEQRGAAQKIALLYEMLHDEAVLRNQTFRVVFDLDAGKWHVERGSAGAVIYATPEAREAAEERRTAKVEDMTPEQLAAWKAEHAQFDKVSDEQGWSKSFELPQNAHFKSVFTPQYAEPVVPTADQRASRKKKRDDDAGPQVAIATSYIFANGFAEYTVIQIVDKEDPTEGFTITVDPLSGRVQMVNELVDHEDAFDWLPDKPPSLEL